MNLSRGLRVELRLEVPDTRPPLRRWLPAELSRLAAWAGVPSGRLTVVAVGDPAMSELHARHRGVAGTTDVLTFDLRDEPVGPIDADVVVCLDEAARQAGQRGHAVRLEVLLYALHGLLHLIGYDDHSAAAAGRMHRREDELLSAAGWGPVFKSRPSKG